MRLSLVSFRAAALPVALAMGTSFGHADPSGFAPLDAAVTLYEIGSAEERPDLLLSAMEIVAEVSPLGAPAWIDAALSEVRFLARGDTEVRARANALALTSEQEGLGVLPVRDEGATLTLPPGRWLGRVRLPTGLRLGRIIAEDGTFCDLGARRITDCSVLERGGELRIEIAPELPAIVLYQTVPAQPGPGE
ncbi:MAG: hypothetical protein AAF646_04685 [Pseudomonadota bacterium]